MEAVVSLRTLAVYLLVNNSNWNKMKTLSTLIIFMVLCLASCQKNQLGAVQQTQQGRLPDLKLQQIKSYLPLHLTDGNQFAVFRNSQGEEKPLWVEWSESEKDKVHIYNGQSYKSERVVVAYRDATDAEYELNVTATANYTHNGYLEFLTATIRTTVNNGYTPMVTVSPDSGTFLPCEYLSNLDLLGRSFADVYTSCTNELDHFKSFSKLFYVAELGIVGFEGWNGEMWVLDRFEE